MPESLSHEQLIQLRNLIHQSFSLDEFRTLCFDLGVRYDDLSGDGLEGRVNNLVLHCQNRGLTERLLTYCSQKHPELNWLGLNKIVPIELVSPSNLSPKPRRITIETIKLPGCLVQNVAIAFSIALIAILVFSIRQIYIFRPTPTPTSSVIPTLTTTPTVITTRVIMQTATISPSPSGLPIPTSILTPDIAEEPTLAGETTVDLFTPPINPQLADYWTRPLDGMQMVYVSGGIFLMGSDPSVDQNAQNDELPRHEVTVNSFWLDRTEVTNNQFAIFATETGYITKSEIEGGGYSYISGSWQYILGANWQQPQGPESNINDLDNHPVVLVSWDDANAYCTWAGGQLPTEAQWEYAARGNDRRLYPWGNTFDGLKANFCDINCDNDSRDTNINDGYKFTAPVGSFSPEGDSWVNAADMAGNVWEWVTDWWYSSYSSVPTIDPTGPTSGNYKVLRGGSWHYSSPTLRVTERSNVSPSNSYDSVGFRCVILPRN